MEYPEPATTVRYWDVFPKLINGVLTPAADSLQTASLSIAGSATGVVYESQDTDIATVSSGGVVSFGHAPGRTTIKVWETANTEYVREVAVEVRIAGLGTTASAGAAASSAGTAATMSRSDHAHALVWLGYTGP